MAEPSPKCAKEKTQNLSGILPRLEVVESSQSVLFSSTPREKRATTPKVMGVVAEFTEPGGKSGFNGYCQALIATGLKLLSGRENPGAGECC